MNGAWGWQENAKFGSGAGGKVPSVTLCEAPFWRASIPRANLKRGLVGGSGGQRWCWVWRDVRFGQDAGGFTRVEAVQSGQYYNPVEFDGIKSG